MNPDTNPSGSKRRARALHPLAALLLPLLLAGCGAREATTVAVAKNDPLPAARARVARSASVAADRVEARGKEAGEGILDRLFGRRAVSRFTRRPVEEESPRDRLIRLKADQTVHIRRGGVGQDWHRASGVTPEEMQALEDEYWLDPEVRAAVLDRVQRAMNANKRPMR